LILSLTLGLSACGGTSSDNNNNNQNETPNSGASSGGSSNSGSSNVGTTQNVTGRVADGYLVGATVCLDKNINGACDSGEPSATTISGGQYELKNVNQADLAKYPVVVEVNSATVDEDTGSAVSKPYTLSAPPGKPQFVSPITTLIANKVLTDPNTTLEQAEVEVKANIGEIDPYKDFIEAKKTDDKYKKVHKIAQVVTQVMAEQEASIKQTLADNNLNLGEKQQLAIMAVITKVVNEVVAKVVSTIEEASDTQSVMPPRWLKRLSLQIPYRRGS